MTHPKRCFCPCHEFPGVYRTEPCSVCGHFNSRGRFPDNVRGGWVAQEDELVKELPWPTVEQQKQIAKMARERNAGLFAYIEDLISKSKQS